MILRADAFYLPLRSNSVHCCVTSPPYWGLRHYDGLPGSGLGLENRPEEFIDRMVVVFREIRRVLHSTGTCWLDIGDKYIDTEVPSSAYHLKPKDLSGVPWRLAFALQADGWWLRRDVIWSKPNPMPEGSPGTHWERHRPSQEKVCPGCHKCQHNDGLILKRSSGRPTGAHEFVFLLTKSEDYYFDQEAIRDRSGLSVWTIPSEQYSGRHFAAFPQKLVEPCILSGSSPAGVCCVCGSPWVRIYNADYERLGNITEEEKARDPRQGNQRATRAYGRARKVVETLGWRRTCGHSWAESTPSIVLDPFAGTGTVGRVAIANRRRAVLCDLSMVYLQELAKSRTRNVQIEAIDD